MNEVDLSCYNLVKTYYHKKTGKFADEEKRTFIKKAMASGISAHDLMDAIDAAVIKCGLYAVERDYWHCIADETRQRWRELQRIQRENEEYRREKSGGV